MEELNVIVLMKGDERYVFLYDDKSADSLSQIFGKYATDESLSFTFYDATILNHKVRKMKKESEEKFSGLIDLLKGRDDFNNI